MKSRIKYIFLLFMSFMSLVFCACSDKRPIVQPIYRVLEKGSLRVQIKGGVNGKREGKTAFVRGAPSKAQFVLENQSDDFIILRSFQIKGQLPDIKRWFGPLYGSVEYVPEKDIFLYNGIEQCLSEPLFVMGLIRPREKIEISRDVAFNSEGINCEIYFHRLSPSEAKERLYFNFPDEPGVGPKRIFRPIEDLMPYLNEDKRDLLDWSTVILRSEKKLSFELEKAVCGISLRNREFTIEDAWAKAGAEVLDYIYWTGENSWMLKTGQGVILVNKDQVTQLGDIELKVITLIELSSDRVDFILPMKGYNKFHSQKPRIEGPGYFNPGVTTIPHGDILDLFKYAGSLGDSIKVLTYDPHGLGRRFYILVGNFDENARRAFAEGSVN